MPTWDQIAALSSTGIFNTIGVVTVILVARWFWKYRVRIDQFWDVFFDIPAMAKEATKSINDLNKTVSDSLAQNLETSANGEAVIARLFNDSDHTKNAIGKVAETVVGIDRKVDTFSEKVDSVQKKIDLLMERPST